MTRRGFFIPSSYNLALPLNPLVATSYGYLDVYNDASDLSIYTFSDTPLGAADSARDIIVGISSRDFNQSPSSLDSVTIGGQSATVVASGIRTGAGANVWNIAALAIASVPAGDDGDIVVEFGTQVNACCVGVYRAIGLPSITPHDTDEKHGGDGVPIGGTINVPSNGFAICVGFNVAAVGDDVCDLTGLTERYDFDFTGTGYKAVGGDTNTPGDVAWEMDWPGQASDDFVCGAVASWSF